LAFVVFILLLLRFCFFLLYVHIFRCVLFLLIFDCAVLVWFFGFVIYFLFIIIAFIGYVLPLTQMSFWGLTVFSNILTTVPIIGLWVCYWIWGCEFIQDFTLYKCHSLHILFPFVLLFCVVCHFFLFTLLFEFRWFLWPFCVLCWTFVFL